MTPATVGPYEVLSVIGRGGLATVYRARHLATDRHVALKLVPPPSRDPVAAARRLSREFEALHGLDHPNVVRVFESGVHDGQPYLAMELVLGLDLRSYLSPALDDGAGPAPASSVPACVPELESWSAEPQTEGLSACDDCAGEAHPERDAAPGVEVPLSGSLLERLNRPARLVRLHDAMLQVCDALAYVHERGLVHRDLKPSNIMVDDARRVKLMDFGLVKRAGEPPRGDDAPVVGTYRYMAPEQAHGEAVDERADLYSLGVILFEVTCGRPPARGRAGGERAGGASHLVALRTLNPGIADPLARVTERLLAADPCQRFACARDVAAALRAARG